MCMRLHRLLLMTAGLRLLLLPMNRGHRRAVIRLAISVNLAAPTNCRAGVSILDPHSTVASVVLRRSPPRSRTASLVLTATRRIWARRTLATRLHCVSPRATGPLGGASRDSYRSLTLMSRSFRSTTSMVKHSFMRPLGLSATAGNL